MFVLLGPDFEATPEAYARLEHATGLLSYDLRSRIRAGAWSVVKTLADPAEARALAAQLTEWGFRPVLLDRSIAYDPERYVVPLSGVEPDAQGLTLRLPEREMRVEFSALACIVRGEVQPGRQAQRGSPSLTPGSGSFRVSGGVELTHREQQNHTFDSYQAADFHFVGVLWIGRLSLRELGSAAATPPRILEQLVDQIALQAHVRVDRASRTSSVASFVEQAAPLRTMSSEPPGLREARRELGDQRFDPYSRVIGEAERNALESART
ncbi:MAG TPA: hypothetical protein VFQ61_07500 [Polyangiaceae bacterium]|nr:hypothetical protein [Polyangiaceae bacterium]